MQNSWSRIIVMSLGAERFFALSYALGKRAPTDAKLPREAFLLLIFQ